MFLLAGILPAFKSDVKYAITYSLLNHGPVYPKGGILQLIEAIEKILNELKVLIYYNSAVENFDIIDNKLTGIITHGKTVHADIFISVTDYYHTEQLIPKEYRNYYEKQ